MATNSTSVQAAAGVIRASRTALSHPGSFLVVFAAVFLTTVGIAAKLDVLPNPPKASVASESTQPLVLAAAASPVITTPELPTKVEIPSISLSQQVSNPTSLNVEDLDHALLTGPARYPSSSKLGETGTLIIFGHSSYLPIVNNKAYKAFDGIQKLKAGDQIVVTGSAHTYVYAVQKVEKKNATEDAIPLSSTGSTLVLATCDSFGEKTDRFVVTAELVSTRTL
jgi:LPXTG-site transpeptidase (sortase) family protein